LAGHLLVTAGFEGVIIGTSKLSEIAQETINSLKRGRYMRGIAQARHTYKEMAQEEIENF